MITFEIQLYALIYLNISVGKKIKQKTISIICILHNIQILVHGLIGSFALCQFH